LLGDEPIEIKHFLMGLRGFLWVWIMGSQNVMGSDYGSNISGTVDLDPVFHTGTSRVNHGSLSFKASL
jgi:hypothetical protein